MSEQVDSEPVWYESGQGEVGGFALEALTAISADALIPDDGRRRWLASDHESLRASLEFEAWIEGQGLPADAPRDVRRELNGDLSSWHVALPFSEAERRLVVDAYANWFASRELPTHVRSVIRAEEVIDAGTRTVVRGRNLMRRWWSWRRDLDEFEGQGGLTQARIALSRFAGRLVPPEKMPGVYYDLLSAPDHQPASRLDP